MHAPEESPTSNANASSARKAGDSTSIEARDDRAARAFVTALHASARAVRLYPAENVAVRKAVGDLIAARDRLALGEGQCVVRRVGEYLFVNDTRLRLTLDNFASVSAVGSALGAAGVGGFAVVASPDAGRWIAFLGALAQPRSAEDVDGAESLERLTASAGDAIELLPVTGEEEAEEIDDRERARQTYARSIDVTREVISAARLGRNPGLRRVKRAVQDLVDAILTDPSSMIGLTTLREFDDYTFVHSVNVCILSIALGRRIGFSRRQLLDLGLAALMHDIGKSRVSVRLLNSDGPLTDADRERVRAHTWLGMLTLFQLPASTGRPWRSMAAAFEHHRKIDQTGYPAARASRPLSLFSKIIAVCDGYDAATTIRSYQKTPWSPADVLRGMRDNARLGLDPVIVKAFINLTGIYPIGTFVVLDTFEFAVVARSHDDPSGLSRPIVRLLSDAQGNRLAEAPYADLMEVGADSQFRRTIIRTEDPERYGIRVGDYVA